MRRPIKWVEAPQSLLEQLLVAPTPAVCGAQAESPRPSGGGRVAWSLIRPDSYEDFDVAWVRHGWGRWCVALWLLAGAAGAAVARRHRPRRRLGLRPADTSPPRRRRLHNHVRWRLRSHGAAAVRRAAVRRAIAEYRSQ